MITDELNFEPDIVPPKEKPPNDLEQVFVYLHSLNVSKDNVFDEKQYRKLRFTILRALSLYPELIGYVNLVNQMNMPPRMEYDFLLHMIPPKVRREKWIKKNPKSVFLQSVQEYYGYNENKAQEVMKLLSVEQMTMIEKRIMKKDHVCEEMISFTDSASK